MDDIVNLDNEIDNDLEDSENADEQCDINEKRLGYLKPYQWKKGQSGNPKGRPKGKSMKEYARQLLERQTEEERQEFLHGLPKEIIWKMAEGNPKQDTEVTGKDGKDLFTGLTKEQQEKLDNLLNYNATNVINKECSEEHIRVVCGQQEERESKGEQGKIEEQSTNNSDSILSSQEKEVETIAQGPNSTPDTTLPSTVIDLLSN